MYRAANEWLAIKLSDAFGTMTFFWACNALVAVPFIFPSLMQIVQFISSGWLQLIALPLLAVQAAITQRQQAEHSRTLADLHDKHDALHSKLHHLTKKEP